MAVKRARLSILGLMAVIVLIAVSFAALRTPTILGASLIFTATVAFLSTAILAAMTRRGRARMTWAGIMVFGWAYLAISFGPFPNGNGVTCPPFPTQVLIDYLRNVREESDKAQHPLWRLGVIDSLPGDETILNAPRTAYWMPRPAPSMPGSAGGPTLMAPPGTPRPPTVPYLDWRNQRRIGHSLGAILFGLLGGLIGLGLARRDEHDRPSDGG
jgi:hypothetical protein